MRWREGEVRGTGGRRGSGRGEVRKKARKGGKRALLQEGRSETRAREGAVRGWEGEMPTPCPPPQRSTP